MSTFKYLMAYLYTYFHLQQLNASFLLLSRSRNHSKAGVKFCLEIIKDQISFQPERVSFASLLQSPTDLSGFLLAGGHGYLHEFFLLDVVYEYDAVMAQWTTREGRLPAAKSWMVGAVVPSDFTC